MVKRGSVAILITIAVVAVLGLGFVITDGELFSGVTGAQVVPPFDPGVVLNPNAVFLAADEEAIDNGNTEIERIASVTSCGGGKSDVCINDDRPGLGQRDLLVLNSFPGAVFVMSTGEIGDEALFGGFGGTSLPDPLFSAKRRIHNCFS